MRDLLTAVREFFRIWTPAKRGAELPQSSSPATAPSRRSREKKLTALGVILLGLWGMLALLLGASVGMESNYRRTVHLDMEPGFGETHATRHPRNEDADGYAPDALPPPCLGKDCPGIEQAADTGYPGAHRTDVPGDDVDDATSAIGRPQSPQTPPTFTGDPVPNWLFVPGGGGNPGGPDIDNPLPGGPDIHNPPQNPGDTPPPDFTQPPFSNPPGPDGPGDGPSGPNGPGGPDGPAGPGGPDGPSNQPDPPQQLPEPLTLSLFAGGLAGSILLRRRRNRSSK